MIDHIQRFTIPAAYSLLPEAMQSDKATALLLAIGLQESDGFSARRQYQRGAGHGFWQFELRGVRGVLLHERSREVANDVVDALRYRLTTRHTDARQAVEVYDAVTHNDTLACCWARLLLWTLPMPLPGPGDADLAWGQYLAAWRPGKPHPETWDHYYAEAWQRVTAGGSS